ncbi:hypothetical protein GMB86_10295 [Terrilactibacillus sp. BCM23-1]|uniref:DUF5362 domain-containing protein n=1 Tax=Terrilactibacillus tamarindi TaxID=2599694 RepID=A0A6N8CTT0_9BACI|nr:DUF5362 family protein [Terrilactibacillus tamarindi]MTT32395.1 hypothetical protein [Terrilactibacillus tamarindi]
MNHLKSLQRISFWGRFTGIVTIVFGSFAALGGLFALIIGAIPGIIQIILGVYLFKTGTEAKYAIEDNETSDESLHRLLNNYSKYLLIQGIFTIIVLAFVALMIILSLVLGNYFFSEFHFT